MPGPDAAARRFVRALVRAGSARCDDGGMYRVATGTVRAALTEAETGRLANAGVVRLDRGLCRPTEASAAWLAGRRPGPTAGTTPSDRPARTGGSASPARVDHPLARLAQSLGEGFFEPHHLAAGERVCRWGQRAQLRQRVTMSYDPAQVGGRRHGGAGTDIADMAAEARKSIARLYADLPRDCAEILVDVCVFEKGLQTIESERGWPRRSAKLVLRIGLDQLATRLGLLQSARGRPSGPILAWLGDGFAPTRFE